MDPPPESFSVLCSEREIKIAEKKSFSGIFCSLTAGGILPSSKFYNTGKIHVS